MTHQTHMFHFLLRYRDTPILDHRRWYCYNAKIWKVRFDADMTHSSALLVSVGRSLEEEQSKQEQSYNRQKP